MIFQAPEEIVQELYQCTLPDAKCSEHVPGLGSLIIAIMVTIMVTTTIIIATAIIITVTMWQVPSSLDSALSSLMTLALRTRTLSR